MSVSKQFKWALLGATALALTTSHAMAAGFQLKEQSSSLQGLSFAGATAKADDLSTIFFNPAGMTRIQGSKMEAHATYIKPSAELTLGSVTPSGAGTPVFADGNGGDAGVGAVVPALYMVTDLDNGMKFGLSINTPFGLSTKYDDGWAGRYYALESKVETINIQPSLAKKINDKWSVGGGIQLQYVSAHLSNAINSTAVTSGVVTTDGKSVMDGDDFALGYTLGVLFEPSDKTRVGLSYRSEIKHTLEGDLDIQGAVGSLGVAALSDAEIEADLTTPSTLSLGLFHEINDQWSVMSDVALTGWSSFSDLTVKNKSNGLVRQSVDESWKDTLFVSVGTEYKPDDKSAYQFGIALDQSAVDNEHRTFRIPEADRTWLSFGYKRDLSENTSFTVGYSHIMASSATVNEDVNNAGQGVVTGTYDDSSVNILTVGYHKKF